MQLQLITLKSPVAAMLHTVVANFEPFVARVDVLRVLCAGDKDTEVNVRALQIVGSRGLDELRKGIGYVGEPFVLTLNPTNILSRQILAYNVELCGKCKAANAFVNACGCDPNNMPTRIDDGLTNPVLADKN